MVKEEEKEIKLAIGNAPAVVPMCLPLSLLAINLEHRSLEESMVVNTRRSIGDCKKIGESTCACSSAVFASPIFITTLNRHK